MEEEDEEGLMNQKRVRTDEASSVEQPSYKKRRLGPKTNLISSYLPIDIRVRVSPNL